MIEEIGRNDACPRGSGKKYKQCCLETDFGTGTNSIGDFGWRKLRQLEGVIVDKHLMPYVTNRFPKEAIQMALDDFSFGELPEQAETDLFFTNFFIPWFLFNWIPLDDLGIDGFIPELTIAQNYMETHHKRLAPDERRFIEAMGSSHYSYPLSYRHNRF